MSKLIVLGLLRNKEMHGYEIQTIIQESRIDQWANVLSGSIYYALNKMEEEAVIEAIKEERTGARIRKIYKITKRGEEEYQKLLRETLKLQPHSIKSNFMLSLSMIHHLPKDEALSILNENLEQLASTKQEWAIGKENKSKTIIYNSIMEYSFDNTLQIIDADIQLIKKTIEFISKQ
jgi:DNA-binding PadR family transcriptional regulator